MISHFSKFVVLTLQSDFQIIKEFLFNHKILNIVLISENEVTIPNKFTGLNERKLNDKLGNLNGWKMHVIFGRMGIDAQTHESKYHSRFINFLDIVRDYMNATIKIIEVAKDWKTFEEFLNKTAMECKILRNSSKFDFTISEFIKFNDFTRKFITYDSQSVSFVLRTPPEIPKFAQLLFMPFEKKIWMCLGISIVFSILVWQFSNDSSSLDFFFAIYGFFLVQSTDLKM